MGVGIEVPTAGPALPSANGCHLESDDFEPWSEESFLEILQRMVDEGAGAHAVT